MAVRREEPDFSDVRQAFRACWSPLTKVGVFSACINVLSLTGSIYMLQISDRVLASRSLSTLVGLSLLALAAYALHGILDALRGRMLARIGVKFGNQLAPRIFEAITSHSLKGARAAVTGQGLRDLDQVQRFLSGVGPTAFFDMPFIPLFIGITYLLHPVFGWMIILGALGIVVLSALAEMRTRAPMLSATVSGTVRHSIVETSQRNVEALRAMGMMGVFSRRFTAANARFAAHGLAASDASSGIGSLAKVFRAVLQSSVYGVGAYLTIYGEVTAGATIAASILAARALAPVEIAVAHWRGFIGARQGFGRLDLLLMETGSATARLQLPPPESELSVDNLYVVAPGSSKPILSAVSFDLAAGQGLAVIGPSASGKSTLARALIGLWPAARGKVALDGAPLDHWDPQELGGHLGYLPQNIELFDGTIAENIARFDPDAPDEAILRAARDARAHDMILDLPAGYETRIGDGGAALSAGQRQRVALARALYGEPFLVVLDEPNSNLDAVGEDALLEAMRSVQRRGGILVVITHKPSVLPSVDHVLVLVGGRVQAFGPTHEVLGRMNQPARGETVPARAARQVA